MGWSKENVCFIFYKAQFRYEKNLISDNSIYEASKLNVHRPEKKDQVLEKVMYAG